MGWQTSQGASQEKRKKIIRFLNFTFDYADDILSQKKFCNYGDRIYPIVLEIKDDTYTVRFVSYLNIHLQIYTEGWLRANSYDKKMISILPFYNFHLFIATLQQLLYMEYISFGGEYERVCGSYKDFLDKGCC